MVSGSGTGDGESGDRVEGDLVAEGFELVDVGGLATLWVVAAVEEIRPEVGEVGVGIGQQEPDDDQDRAADRDEGLLAASAAGHAPGALAEGGVGPSGRRCRPPEASPREAPAPPAPGPAPPIPRARYRLPCPVAFLPRFLPADSFTA